MIAFKGQLESGALHSSVVLDNSCLILEPDLLHVEEGPILIVAQDLSARLAVLVSPDPPPLHQIRVPQGEREGLVTFS